MTIAACSSSPSKPASTGNTTGTSTTAAAAGVDEHAGHDHSWPATPAPTAPLRTGERFENLAMARPYTPQAPDGGTDEYRCLVLDPHLSKAQFLTGTQFSPGNVPIVHHAIVFAIPPEEAAAARAKDAASGGNGWTCFGSDVLGPDSKQAWVDTWTPNATEALLQQDVGFPLKPGSLLVLQIHYNLLATGGRAGSSDQSGVRLRLTDGTAATQPLITTGLSAPIELPCAAGESGPLCDRAAAVADVVKRFGNEGVSEDKLLRKCGNGSPVPGNTQHCDYPIPVPMTVYATLGHMHLLGRSIKIELNPGTPKAQTLLDVPNFDFDYQRFTPLATPVQVKPGDVVRVTCTHDATLRRQLPQLKTLPPRYVVWGDGTSDEMCLGLLTATVKK
ncbi:MAG: monooxygenase [Catenulispora sp.]|nr:monooxygenase [Catenulispora sp.]